jgi:hypothetical protein
MNKTQSVLSHLQRKRSITSWQAIEMFKATRLADIIFRLRCQGHNIVSETITNDNATFARYRLK